MLREGGLANEVLTDCGIGVQAMRSRVEQLIGRGEADPKSEIPFTPHARRVLDRALDECKALGDTAVASHHILLAAVREDEGVASRLLLQFDVPVGHVRRELMARIGEAWEPVDEASGPRAEKEAAIEAGDFHRAAVLRAREQRLLRGGGAQPAAPYLPDARTDLSLPTALSMVVGAALLAAGILIGWAIWS